MITRKMGKCKQEQCNYNGLLYSKGFCETHYWAGRRGNKTQKIKINSKFERRYKPTGEKLIFESVWIKQQGKCFITGQFIPFESAKASNFVHILAKGQNKYPEYKLFEPNIKLCIERFHHLYDHSTKDKIYDEFSQFKERVDLFFDIREKLIING